MKRYEFIEVVNDRWAIWYIQFPKRKGAKIGCYKIIDLFSGTREKKYAFRFLPREGQSQEQSDALIKSNAIHNFYRRKVFMGNRGGNGQLTEA